MKNYIVTRIKNHVFIRNTFMGYPKYIKDNNLYQKDGVDTYLGEIVFESDTYPELEQVRDLTRGKIV